MLYIVDESCLSALQEKNIDCIGCLEELANSRRKCHILLGGERRILFEIAKSRELSTHARAVYKKLANNASEYKIYLESVSKYCRVVANEKRIGKKTDGNKEIIIIPTNLMKERSFSEVVIFLGENVIDTQFYKYIGQYYLRKQNCGNINIAFEKRTGGGSTIASELEMILKDEQRLFFCIVDSDRKDGKSPFYGDTREKVESVLKNFSQNLGEVVFLEVHEVENLIPYKIINQIASNIPASSGAIKFMDFLRKSTSVDDAPLRYFDIKGGLPKKNFILLEEDMDRIKRFSRLEEYRKYWMQYLNEYGIIDLRNIDGNVIVSGISKNILKHALTYMEGVYNKGQIDDVVIDDYIKEEWDKIGEKVFTWGCVGNRIAV